MLFRARNVLLFISAVQAACWGDIGYTPLWQVSGRGGFSTPNQIKDPSSGATLGFVLCEADIGVVCLDLAGNRVWEYPMEPPVAATPAVADLNGDGREEIVAADSKGNLVALTADGATLWRQSGAVARVEPDSCPAIADLDGDNKPEVLVGDTEGTLSCLTSEGALRWQFTGDGSQMGPVLVADLYDLPGSEIIVTSHDSHIYALSSEGEWLWDVFRGNDLFPNSTPVLADVDGDKIPEIYIGGGLHHFYRIDPRTGAVVFEQNVYLHINAAIAAGDLNGDGRDEVVFGNKGGEVWCYGGNGFLWRHELRRSNLFGGPVLMDVNGDGRIEVLFHASQQDIQVFDADGAVLASLSTPVGAMTVPLVGDFDGDGGAELLSTSQVGAGQAGMAVCARLGVPWVEDARNQTTFAGNRARSGQSAGGRTYAPAPVPAMQEGRGGASVAPVGDVALVALFTGRNAWRFDVDNPEGRRLALLTRIVYPHGVVRGFARHVYGPKERLSISFDVRNPGAYAVAQTLVDAENHERLVTRTTSVPFNGFDGDYAYLDEKVFRDTENAIRAWQTENEAVAAGIGQQLDVLKAQLAAVAAAPEETRAARSALLRGEAERLRDVVRAGVRFASTGSFFAWPYSPWAYFDPKDTLPAPDGEMDGLRASLLQGEYASLAVNVTNVSTRPLEVRVSCGELKGPVAAPSPEHVVLRRAVVVPTIRRELVADALPVLDQGGLLRLAPLESQQLWITLNAGDLPPGEYVVPLALLSLEPDPTERSLSIEMTVCGLAPPRPSPLRFCVWSTEKPVLGTNNDEVLADLTAHGVNVFFGQAPKAECDAQGNLVGPVDFTAHDVPVARYHPHGLVMFIGAQDSLTGAPFLSPAWRTAYVAYVRAWAEHMKALGLEYGDWALYPYDEPSSPYTDTTLNLVEVAKLTRQADPNVRIYTDPTSGTTMKSIEMLTGLIDIWCPSSELLERLADEMVPVIKQNGKEVWFYDAAGHAKTLSTLGIYRWRFWHAWNMGFTGVGWWVYASSDQQWKGWNPSADFFCSVYPGREGVVTSKRWEAAREGVQDYTLLYLLRERVRGAEARGVSDAALTQARELLVELPETVEKTLLRAGRRLPLTPDGVPMYEEVTGTLRAAREQLIAACLSLDAPKEATP